MDIRRMEVHDAAGMLPLLDVLGWGAELERVTERLERLIGRPDHAAWVAEHRGRIIGFATGELHWMVQTDEPVAELNGLAVLPDAAGRGAGSALLNDWEEWARASGARRWKITSGDHRPDAHAFYERRGYVRTGVRFHKTADGSPPTRGAP